MRRGHALCNVVVIQTQIRIMRAQLVVSPSRCKLHYCLMAQTRGY